MVILGSFCVEIKNIFGSWVQLMFMKRSHWKKKEKSIAQFIFLSLSQFFLVTTNKVSTFIQQFKWVIIHMGVVDKISHHTIE